MATLAQLRASTSDGTLPAYEWPGGYPMEYVTYDCLTICPRCANAVDHDDREDICNDYVVSGNVYWEGPPFPCDDCGRLIESAYGEMMDGER